MPFSWNYWKQTQDKWKILFNKVKECGFAGDDMPKAGCHIHLDKRPFTHFHLYKFLRFIFVSKLKLLNSST